MQPVVEKPITLSSNEVNESETVGEKEELNTETKQEVIDRDDVSSTELQVEKSENLTDIISSSSSQETIKVLLLESKTNSMENQLTSLSSKLDSMQARCSMKKNQGCPCHQPVSILKPIPCNVCEE